MLDAIKRHVAGVTQANQSPFARLPSPIASHEFVVEEVEKYVLPFYMTQINSVDFSENFNKITNSINTTVVYDLLGHFNWRQRSCGAIFAAIKGYVEHTFPIGVLLLKSEVCYAGASYCLALAKFNTHESRDFIKLYLEHYLDQKDKWFDQNAAMAALAYLDELNSTSEIEHFMPKWEKFISDKSNWSLESSVEKFNSDMEGLKSL